MKLLHQCFLIFIVVVIPGHNLGNSQVSVNRTIGPTLVRVNFCARTGSFLSRLRIVMGLTVASSCVCEILNNAFT